MALSSNNQLSTLSTCMDRVSPPQADGLQCLPTSVLRWLDFSCSGTGLQGITRQPVTDSAVQHCVTSLHDIMSAFQLKSVSPRGAFNGDIKCLLWFYNGLFLQN